MKILHVPKNEKSFSTPLETYPKAIVKTGGITLVDRPIAGWLKKIIIERHLLLLTNIF